jgi:hypothetical protein
MPGRAGRCYARRKARPADLGRGTLIWSYWSQGAFRFGKAANATASDYCGPIRSIWRRWRQEWGAALPHDCFETVTGHPLRLGRRSAGGL